MEFLELLYVIFNLLPFCMIGTVFSDYVPVICVKYLVSFDDTCLIFLFWDVSTSAVDLLERLVFEMTSYGSVWMSNFRYLLTPKVVFLYQFAEVEEPVRRKVNNVAWTGATTKGCETMRKMRGLSVLPQQLDFGVLKEGSTYSFTMSLQNTGIDACRFRVRQPPPGTGIRVLFKPGPVGKSHVSSNEILTFCTARR